MGGGTGVVVCHGGDTREVDPVVGCHVFVMPRDVSFYPSSAIQGVVHNIYDAQLSERGVIIRVWSGQVNKASKRARCVGVDCVTALNTFGTSFLWSSR